MEDIRTHKLMTVISHISYHVPNLKYFSSQIRSKGVKRIIQKTGIDKKYKTKKNEYATDLAVIAINKILKKNDNLKNKIDFLIYCSQSPDFALPSGSSFIQKRIFKNKNIPAIDINLGCSGFVYSLFLAHALLKSNSCNKILLVTSDTYSKYIDDRDLTNRLIFGDGSSACVLEKSETDYMKFSQGTDGSGIHDLFVINSGLRKTNITDYKNVKSKKLIMNGLKLFDFSVTLVPKLIKQNLKKNKLKLKEVDLFILHQANAQMLQNIRDKLKLDEKKFYINLKDKGNTTSSSIPIAIVETIKNKILKKNMKVNLCGFGVGLSWSSTIIKFYKIPKIYF